jgi:thiamine monophosphate synthase
VYRMPAPLHGNRPALALRGYYAILDVRPRFAPAPGGGPPDQDSDQDSKNDGWDDEAVPLAAEVMRAEQLLAAKPCCLQLRAKRLPIRPLLELAARLVPLCRQAGVPFCVNDRLDLALVVAADAVHLGQEDLSLADARRVLGTLGRSLLLGVSTHSLD